MIYDMRLFYARLFSVLHCSILCHLCHELGFWYRAWSLDALKTLEFGFWLLGAFWIECFAASGFRSWRFRV